MSSNALVGVTVRGINSASQVTSVVLRHILLNNKKSLRHIEIGYQTDVLREETRICVEEIGLEEFSELASFGLHMNRAYLLTTDICPQL